MKTRTIIAVALSILALAACKKDRKPQDPDGDGRGNEPVETPTNGLSVGATYFGDYYGKGFQDYILLFQLGEIGDDGAFALSGVELSLEVLTAQGGPTYFPEGVYEITNANFNTAGIVPSIEQKDEDGNTFYGDTYLYTQQDANNYWLEAVDEATLDVAVNGSQYTIKVNFTVGGEDYSYLYKGALPIENKASEQGDDEEPDGPEGDYDFVPDGAEAFNLGHEWGNDTDDWEVYLVNSKDDEEWIQFEFVTDASSKIDELPTGNFTVPADFYTSETILAGTLCPFYQLDDSNFGTYYVFGSWIWYSASAGNLRISKSGTNYTIELTFTDSDFDNAKVTSKYVGTVAVSTDYYNDGSNAQALNLKKALQASRKPAAKRTATNKRQVKSVCGNSRNPFAVIDLRGKLGNQY